MRELWRWITRPHPWFCPGLGLATHDTFSAGSIFTSSCILTRFILQLGDTRNSHLLTPGLRLSNTAGISPHRPPSLRLCPQEKQLISKDLPSPSKSLGCHRSSRTRLQTKNHLRQAKGIYCLSSKKFCTRASPARD